MNQTYSSRHPICARCTSDDDLQTLIKDYNGPRGCTFCEGRDAPTMPFDEFVDHILACLNANFSKAVEELPYDSGEGGYQGWTSDTYDLLYETIGLDLPRDFHDRLRWALAEEIGDDVWCEHDWLVLDHDASLKSSWNEFCAITKNRRRFFFHNVNANDGHDPDQRSPMEFLQEICGSAEPLGLIRTFDVGLRLYRARPRASGERHTTPASLGPPPPKFATQSNRMNPPGISMFYGADRRKLAVAETRNAWVSIGTFQTTRPIRLLDLARLPPVPGFFSTAGRRERLTLSFLHQFSNEIIQPVPRNDRVNIDYIPTQVFTEFLRDHAFTSGPIDGVRYRSALTMPGANVVLFAGPEDVEGATRRHIYTPGDPWLRLVSVSHRKGSV
ncbi:RES family NAD+ phosphorylase (plasmid) [Agrobacterium fabrum]|uniref:HEPN-associated N-terminal domain-containing protein n=1 Tax=Agrobacterium fabrum TaxID=1176649 RepID=UPI0021D0D812|nr:HEPN-associated N-terminal domain-containing protein [Agrobacterium fabrum]UXT61153.1 RES family NAD+ phosphorylase [Agrobacterium fabrum]